jgi:hypothetical protein
MNIKPAFIILALVIIVAGGYWYWNQQKTEIGNPTSSQTKTALQDKTAGWNNYDRFSNVFGIKIPSNATVTEAGTIILKESSSYVDIIPEGKNTQEYLSRISKYTQSKYVSADGVRFLYYENVDITPGGNPYLSFEIEKGDTAFFIVFNFISNRDLTEEEKTVLSTFEFTK